MSAVVIKAKGRINWIRLGREDIGCIDGITREQSAALRTAGVDCKVVVKRRGRPDVSGRCSSVEARIFADGLRLRLRADAATAAQVRAARREAGVRYGPVAS